MTKTLDLPAPAHLHNEARFAALLEDIKARRDEFRDQRHVSQDVVDELKAVGLYRALVPAHRARR